MEEDRAARVAEEWEENPNKNFDGEYTTTVNGHEVRVTRIEYGSDDNTSWVDLWTGDPSGSPAMRVCNPPTLVPDRNGDVTTEVGNFREDPVEAVARVLGTVRNS